MGIDWRWGLTGIPVTVDTTPGAVYIFKRTGTTWALEQEISDQSSGFTSLLRGDVFGSSVSLDGDRLAAGALYDDGHSGSSTGAVYVFKRTGTTWALEQEISDQSSGFTALRADDWFGNSVSLDGDRLAVGARGDDGASGTNTGAVYTFHRSRQSLVTGWHSSSKLRDRQGSTQHNSWQNFKTTNSTAPDCDSNDTFGVASSGAQTMNVTSADRDKYICFRVKNNDNTYGYAKLQIDPIFIPKPKQHCRLGLIHPPNWSRIL